MIPMVTHMSFVLSWAFSDTSNVRSRNTPVSDASSSGTSGGLRLRKCSSRCGSLTTHAFSYWDKLDLMFANLR